MRNFPDQFPIRYVILLDDHTLKRDPDYFDSALHTVLWDKLVKFLHRTPITLEHLQFRYRSVGYRYNETELCRLFELRANADWPDKIAEQLEKIIPEGTFSNGEGLGYDLGLYSYEGMSDIPLFWQVLQNKDDVDYLGKTLGLYYYHYVHFKPLVDRLQRNYQDIKEGNTARWEIQKTEGGLSGSDLTIPYSELWAALDQRQNNGMVHIRAEEADIDYSKIDKKKYAQKPSQIKVKIFRNIDDLFIEEMLSLYALARFCNNCGKMLPFNYKGKYCLEIPENQSCTRERSRKRQKQYSQKSH